MLDVLGAADPEKIVLWPSNSRSMLYPSPSNTLGGVSVGGAVIGKE